MRDTDQNTAAQTDNEHEYFGNGSIFKKLIVFNTDCRGFPKEIYKYISEILLEITDETIRRRVLIHHGLFFQMQNCICYQTFDLDPQ